MINSNELIDKIGGTAVVAKLCDVAPPAVSWWRKNGIPKARLMYLKAIHPELFTLDKEAANDNTKRSKP